MRNQMQAIRNFSLSLLTIVLLLYSGILRAQAEIKVDINKGGDSGGWYTNPVVWIIGAAVFILLLIAILRSGKK